MCNNCQCDIDTINKNDIFNYSFYDDEHKLVTVLNEDKLKQIFNADRIIFNEIEHR